MGFEVDSARAKVQKALEELEAAVRREAEQALQERLRNVLAGAADVPAAPRRGRPPGSKNKPKTDAAAAAPAPGAATTRRNSWSGLTPEQKLARVNAIRKGRGLPPKTA